MTRLEAALRQKDEELKQLEEHLGQLETESGKKTLKDEVSKLKKLLEEERKRSEDYLTRLKYLQADFENYRKRMDREVKEIEDFSITKLVRRLLPILEELELAVNSASSSNDSKTIEEGVMMVLKNLRNILEKEGLKRIEAVGKPFNPALHEAVDKVLGKKTGDDIVIEEIRPGFIFKDKVLRPSMVKVELAQRAQNRNNGEVKEVGEHEQ